MSRHSTKNDQALKQLFAHFLLVAGALGLLAAAKAIGDASIANVDIARQLPNVAAILFYLSCAFLLIRLIDVVRPDGQPHPRISRRGLVITIFNQWQEAHLRRI